MSFFRALSIFGVLVGIVLVLIGWRLNYGLSPGLTITVGLFVVVKETLDIVFAK